MQAWLIATLVQSEPFLAEAPGRLYLTLDDLSVRDRARTHPEELLRSAPRLILDEIQREPDLILALKRVVDQDRPRQPGRFVVTGSANLLLMQRISETLAGRATYVTLWPLTRREKLGLNTRANSTVACCSTTGTRRSGYRTESWRRPGTR